jgi:hypothetical protein
MTVAISGRACHFRVHSVIPFAIDMPSAQLFSHSFSDAVQHVGIGIVIPVFLPHIHLLSDIVDVLYSSGLSLYQVLSVVDLRRRFLCSRAWKLRADRCGRADTCNVVVLSSSSSSSSNTSSGRSPSRGTVGLVEVVEEALLDARGVRIVLVEQGLVDEVLAEPLEGVLCAVRPRCVSGGCGRDRGSFWRGGELTQRRRRP